MKKEHEIWPRCQKSAICYFQESLFNFELVMSSENHSLHVFDRSGHRLIAQYYEDCLQQARSNSGLKRLEYGMAASSTGIRIGEVRKAGESRKFRSECCDGVRNKQVLLEGSL